MMYVLLAFTVLKVVWLLSPVPSALIPRLRAFRMWMSVRFASRVISVLLLVLCLPRSFAMKDTTVLLEPMYRSYPVRLDQSAPQAALPQLNVPLDTTKMSLGSLSANSALLVFIVYRTQLPQNYAQLEAIVKTELDLKQNFCVRWVHLVINSVSPLRVIAHHAHPASIALLQVLQHLLLLVSVDISAVEAV